MENNDTEEHIESLLGGRLRYGKNTTSITVVLV